MATNWTVLGRADLRKVLSVVVSNQANQNTAWETGPNAILDDTQAERMGDLVAMAVAEVRGAIQAGGRMPLSVTAGAVPPSAVPHALYLAAWRLLTSTPGVPMVVVGEQATAKRFHDEACKYLEGLRAGRTVERPTDPTGIDYATAVSASNPAINGVDGGDLYGDIDEYIAGSGTDAQGNTVTLPLDDMTQT
jgi:hypothetical protein